MKLFRLLIPVLGFILIFSSCTKDDPEVIVTVRDVNMVPIPNATVTLYSRPGHFIIEDIDYTDKDGKTYHKFVFEGTLDVVAKINNFSIYDDLRGEGEVTLTRGETSHLELILEEYVPVED
jgi:hypothetical protein